MDFFDGKNVDVLSPDYIAAVYLRLSKEDGDLSGDVDKLESNSIQNQKTLILNYLPSSQMLRSMMFIQMMVIAGLILLR